MHGCFRSFSFLQIVGPLFLCAKEKVFQLTCITCPLRGSIWRRCGSLWRSSAPFRPGFTPYLCTQAAGQCSRRVPQAPAPSFFWAAGGYRATDTFMGLL
ncbi:hypothetical protein EAJ05_01785 [Bacteroides fragilis]|nr:hypothetical protein EAJ05_01785 [Bacteroides fragilis]